MPPPPMSSDQSIARRQSVHLPLLGHHLLGGRRLLGAYCGIRTRYRVSSDGPSADKWATASIRNAGAIPPGRHSASGDVAESKERSDRYRVLANSDCHLRSAPVADPRRTRHYLRRLTPVASDGSFLVQRVQNNGAARHIARCCGAILLLVGSLGCERTAQPNRGAPDAAAAAYRRR